jgi:hypothetical protein
VRLSDPVARERTLEDILAELLIVKFGFRCSSLSGATPASGIVDATFGTKPNRLFNGESFPRVAWTDGSFEI